MYVPTLIEIFTIEFGSKLDKFGSKLDLANPNWTVNVTMLDPNLILPIQIGPNWIVCVPTLSSSPSSLDPNLTILDPNWILPIQTGLCECSYFELFTIQFGSKLDNFGSNTDLANPIWIFVCSYFEFFTIQFWIQTLDNVEYKLDFVNPNWNVIAPTFLDPARSKHTYACFCCFGSSHFQFG